MEYPWYVLGLLFCLAAGLMTTSAATVMEYPPHVLVLLFCLAATVVVCVARVMMAPSAQIIYAPTTNDDYD